jgi:D-xylose transport system substrate-binding protein
MSIRRLAAFFAIAAIILAACTGTTTPTTAPASVAPSGAASESPASSPADEEFVVGVSWNNYDQPRWACCDAPGIRDVVTAAGGKVIETVAANSTEIQLSNIDGLIAQGMDVLILLAKDPEAMQAKIQEVKDLGIPIIGYDRLVDDPDVFYLTFDNQGVGRIMAEEFVKVVTEGQIAIVKGHSADPNADFLREGMTPVLEQNPGLTIPAGCEDYNDNWNTENARNMMTACLGATDNNIVGVISENDSMATGVVTALQEVGLAGTIPVTGQDGDFPALNRVALGTQLVSVWKDSGQLGKVAGALAIQLHEGKQMSELVAPDDIAPYAKPDSLNAVEFQVTDAQGAPTNKVWSITLKPNPVLRANLNEPIDSGWVAKDVVCAGVTDTSAVPACA